MFPGVLKSGSACWRFERCFQVLLKGIEVGSTLLVTLGRTTASTATTLSGWVVGYTLKSTTPHKPECTVMPPMPLICVRWYWHHKWRHCARCSVTKDVDDAEFNSALAMVVDHQRLLLGPGMPLTKLVDDGHSIVTCATWYCQVYFLMMTETRSSASEDWLLYWDEAKRGGVFGTFDTCERKGIASRGGRAWSNWDSTHYALEKLSFAHVVNKR